MDLSSCRVSPTDPTLASSTLDAMVVLWDISRGTKWPTPSLTADFDGNGEIGFTDFLLFAARFGLTRSDEEYDAKFDLDGDGTVGFGDFVIFAGRFGNS